MRGINGEKLGLKYLNVGKILMISVMYRVKCKLCLRSKTPGWPNYKKNKCRWRNPFRYVVRKMMIIFVTRLWCVKVDPFVGDWSKRRQIETLTTKTSTNRNVDKPNRRQTKTSTYPNVDRPITWTNQNVDRRQSNLVHCIIVFVLS